VLTEHVMKSLQSIESADEKLSALCKKYAELLEEHRTTQSSLKQTQRTLSVVGTSAPTSCHISQTVITCLCQI